jgi:hypothetical protein
VVQPYPQGSWFSQLWFYITRGCFHISFSFPDLFVLRKKKFENFIIFFLISNYLPFKKILVLNFHNFESSEPKNALYQVWSKLVQWFWRRSQKCEKFTDRQTTDARQTDDRQTDDRQKAIRKAHLSFQLRWAKNLQILRKSYESSSKQQKWRK